MEQKKQNGFSSKVGLILAAAGSAVGLGNIWKFPYVAGENGGGAFLIVYLICVLLFGLPLLMSEFIIGKTSQKPTISAFSTISGSKGWLWLGGWCVLAVTLMMGFYFVVTGWCFNYLFESVTNSFATMDTAGFSAHFDAISSSKPRMLLCGLIPVLLTGTVLWFDVNKGIERLSKILMPMLLLIMFLMAVRVLMLEGSSAGMRFLFRFEWSQITPEMIMKAAGQCFFSLSLGLGLLITYGAYMPSVQDITSTSLQIVVLDTLVAVLAGIIIFPAVFAFGFNPAEGPELVFEVLPAVLQKMSLSWLSSVLFFTLLCIAALTSTISLMEVVVASICEVSGGRLNRHQSVLITGGIVSVLMALCIFFPQVFTWTDILETTILLPVGALGVSLFVGWFMPMKNKDLVPRSDKRWKTLMRPFLVFALRWIVPAAIILIFLNGQGVF
ncbi:MAG: sodium-dependent transporter [Paludibacteraceae bacterium]|nr:sodium-dependent transporter [Paludibacteraceae bacterium]